MIESVISLVLALVVVGVLYLVLKWILVKIELSDPALPIANLIFGAVVLIMVLKFLIPLVK